MTLAGRLLTLAKRAVETVKDWFRKPPKGPKPPKGGTGAPRWFRFPWWVPFALACTLPTEAGLVSPEPEWLAGYREAEACSGRVGDVTRIRWHVVAESSAVMGHGQLVGYTHGRDIYLSEPWSGQRWLARHESLHALGFHQHDPALFAVKCHATWGAIRDTLDLSTVES